MNKINIACGPDLKEGWTNTDNNFSGLWVGNDDLWNITERAPEKWHGQFDFALVNHIFCLLTYDEVEMALMNISQVLKDGGVIEVIDVNPLKAFRALELGDITALPGFSGSIDNRFTRHLIGYGRKSLWTPDSMCEALEAAGFKNAKDYQRSENDLRPKESLVVRATK